MFRMFRTGARVKRVGVARGSFSHNRSPPENEWHYGATETGDRLHTPAAALQ
jgi:hypothetical protein